MIIGTPALRPRARADAATARVQANRGWGGALGRTAAGRGRWHGQRLGRGRSHGQRLWKGARDCFWRVSSGMRDQRATSGQLLARIAANQHGVLSAGQLRAAGVTKHSITRRVKSGRLHRVHRGVYAVGHARLSFEGRCMAAFIACRSDPAAGNPGAAVSHHSAAALWGLIPAADAPIHISLLSAGGRRRRAGITIHRPPSLCSAELTRRSGIWLTKPARTLGDLGRGGDSVLHQRAIRRALDLRLVAERDLGAEPDLTRSELERMFLRLCRGHRLPLPEMNARITVRPAGPARATTPRTYEVDFLWLTDRLVVETDGFRHHGHREAFERDRARDAALQSIGFRILRFTHRQVKDSPGQVAATLRAVLGDR